MSDFRTDGTIIGLRNAAPWVRASVLEWVDPESEEGLAAAAAAPEEEEDEGEEEEEAERVAYAEKDDREAIDVIGVISSTASTSATTLPSSIPAGSKS